MWPVVKPSISAAEAFTSCTGRVRNLDLRKRLQDIAPIIVADSQTYDASATSTDLHLLQQSDNVGGIVTVGEMVSVYDYRMVPETAPGRWVYDAILLSADDEMCPLCGHRRVKTLDHILAKTRYPSLAVGPYNLIPCCTDCNKSKSNVPPMAKEDQYIHPYYDRVDGDRWLECEIVEKGPAGAHFFVIPSGNWDAVTATRVHGHFERLALARLYASQAGRELSNIRLQLSRLLAKTDPDSVRSHLEDAYESRAAVAVNSWQTALYRAAAENEWYWSGGFNVQ